jgi:hypothetical protein
MTDFVKRIRPQGHVAGFGSNRHFIAMTCSAHGGNERHSRHPAHQLIFQPGSTAIPWHDGQAD